MSKTMAEKKPRTLDELFVELDAAEKTVEDLKGELRTYQEKLNYRLGTSAPTPAPTAPKPRKQTTSAKEDKQKPPFVYDENRQCPVCKKNGHDKRSHRLHPEPFTDAEFAAAKKATEFNLSPDTRKLLEEQARETEA